MAMVKLYKKVRGKKLDDYVAHMDGVRRTLRAHQLDVAVDAEAILAEHRYQGHAKIMLSKGKLDYYVVLSDTRGQWAAGAIEFGREDYIYVRKDKHGKTEVARLVKGMKGLYVLHRAAGIKPRKRRLPMTKIKRL